MQSLASQYVELLQQRFPKTNIYWEKAPDCFFETNPCSLVVARRDNPGNKYTLDFPKGLGGPSVKQDIEVFIEHFAHELDK